MDTSKEYIEMCRKAVEIHEFSPAKIKDIDESLNEISKSHFTYVNRKQVWLPRQDQLQDMLDFGGIAWFTNHNAISRFIEDRAYRPCGEFIIRINSMEQLWLAFVMHEKYNKKWNGEDWVKK